MSKKDILKMLKSGSLIGKIGLIDLDKTLCNGTLWLGDKEHPKVNERMAELVREMDDRGAFIVIWTARPLKLISKTYKWLGENNLQYPLALRQKPPCDFMIDDKAINVDDFLELFDK